MHSNPNATETAAAAHRAAAANATTTDAAALLTDLQRADATMHRGARLSAQVSRDPLMAGVLATTQHADATVTDGWLHLTPAQIERSEYFQHRDFGTGWKSTKPYLPATARWEQAEPNGRGILNSATDEHRALMDLLEAAAMLRRRSQEAYLANADADASTVLSHAGMVLKAQIKRLVMEQDWLLEYLITDAVNSRRQEAR